ncbi:MAG: bactofilin family protein [Flavobacteriales bacterium]|jgi:cytoskeletal protein CcmA (bactofilin family)|tara:strand:+ start:220 stop:603 length:384 start_codon:yes stop_codon:yes gene_type:complete
MKNSDISGQHSRLENTTSVKGDIISEGDFRIDGVLEGSIKTKGKVVIGKEGFVNGSINCLSADVEGKIQGKIYVSEALNLRSTSDINGEVVIGKLIVESGAKFNASCSMKSDKNREEVKVLQVNQAT